MKPLFWELHGGREVRAEQITTESGRVHNEHGEVDNDVMEYRSVAVQTD